MVRSSRCVVRGSLETLSGSGAQVHLPSALRPFQCLLGEWTVQPLLMRKSIEPLFLLGKDGAEEGRLLLGAVQRRPSLKSVLEWAEGMASFMCTRWGAWHTSTMPISVTGDLDVFPKVQEWGGACPSPDGKRRPYSEEFVVKIQICFLFSLDSVPSKQTQKLKRAGL